MATFNNFWQVLTTFTTFNHFLQFLATCNDFEQFWPVAATFNNFWQLLTLYDIPEICPRYPLISSQKSLKKCTQNRPKISPAITNIPKIWDMRNQICPDNMSQNVYQDILSASRCVHVVKTSATDDSALFLYHHHQNIQGLLETSVTCVCRIYARATSVW